MTIQNTRIFEQLESHIEDGHDVQLATYGTGKALWNVAIECRTCHVVLHDIEPEPANGVVSRSEPTGKDPDGTVDVASPIAEKHP